MANERLARDRRLEILDIAGALFLKNGYQGISMSQIAAAVGGSKGTLYAYFDCKEKLFEAFLQTRVRQEGANVFVFPQTADNLPDVLTRFGLKFLEMITGEDSRALLRLLYNEVPRFPQIGRIFYDTCLMSGRKQLTTYLTEADSEGVLRIPDPVLAAEQFLSLCQAKLFMAVMLCVQREIPASEAEAVIRAAVSTFMAAYAAR